MGRFSGVQSPFPQMSPYELQSDASCVGLFACCRDVPVVANKGNIYRWPNSFGLQPAKFVSG